MDLATERGKEYALAKLAERKENRPEKINDASLPAGSDMHYYCKSCGWLSDTKPENWFAEMPRKLCKECQALQDLGWLE